ncbi:unnamed protein product [Ilex paraguariensis]|uniref:Uncharacterized protein n=1 Tax=Ilex paraguariensis TaxID=185542 RepID=A0ABC8T1V1_9AQUA
MDFATGREDGTEDMFVDGGGAEDMYVAGNENGQVARGNGFSCTGTGRGSGSSGFLKNRTVSGFLQNGTGEWKRLLKGGGVMTSVGGVGHSGCSIGVLREGGGTRQLRQWQDITSSPCFESSNCKLAIKRFHEALHKIMVNCIIFWQDRTVETAQHIFSKPDFFSKA